jgi:hypothetical protein
VAKCPSCDGSGHSNRLGGPNSWKCSTCSGTGKVPGRTRSTANACDNCGGSGRTRRLGGPNSSGPCYLCSGTGRKSKPTPRQPTPRQPSPQKSFISVVDELEKLAKLHAAGALTDEEFRQAKRKLLGL